MANRQPAFLSESLSLRFLLMPFKRAFVVLLISLLTFAFSVIIQGSYQHNGLLARELDLTLNIFADTGENSFHIRLARNTYDGLHWLFYGLTGIDSMSAYGPTDSVEEFTWKILEQHKDKLAVFDQSLKIVAVRIGNIVAYIPLFVVVVIASGFDGLIQRRIRQDNATRESSIIYNLSVYWRFGILWTSIILYLSLPFSLPSEILLVPIGLLCILIFIQFKYFKKYL